MFKADDVTMFGVEIWVHKVLMECVGHANQFSDADRVLGITTSRGDVLKKIWEKLCDARNSGYETSRYLGRCMEAQWRLGACFLHKQLAI